MMSRRLVRWSVAVGNLRTTEKLLEQRLSAAVPTALLFLRGLR
jgi:hypothetical protein